MSSGRVAEVHLSNVSGSTFCPCGRCFSCGRRQALPFRCADVHAVTGWIRPHQILGGEFSSLYQNTFHHYRDFWCFDITTRSWDRIETKVRPSARSGHRFAFAFIFGLAAFSYMVTDLEWRCGSTMSFCLVGFMIRESAPVSTVTVTVSAFGSEVNVI